jgi:hypothetical protein
MNTYKNVTKVKVIITKDRQTVLVNPGDVIELKCCPAGYETVLVDVTLSKPKPKIDISDIEEHQTSDLPEDFVVLIDDAVVEDIRKEQTKQLTKKSRGRKAK